MTGQENWQRGKSGPNASRPNLREKIQDRFSHEQPAVKVQVTLVMLETCPRVQTNHPRRDLGARHRDQP